MVGDADTEVLFALALQQIDDGTAPDHALANVVHDVLAITTGRLNLLLADGEHACTAPRVGNSLAQRGPVIASEPVDDDPGWTDIPDHSIVMLEAERVEITAL